MTAFLDERKQLACLDIDALADEMRSLAAFIGTHPELGFQERNALSALSEFLHKHGSKSELGIAEMPTAFGAQTGKGEGPTIAVFVE
jgi:metal-dependent amidase/aminoacylase/carboxypeptidase family protein